MASGTKSPSGVFLYDDFRANLIIDRYDPGFVTMRKSKTDTMRSENSEDALTWNVFRSLAQIDPAFWLPRLFRLAFKCDCESARTVGVKLWQRVPPPPSLLASQGKEGHSEVDVVLENERFVWFIEAKYRSDVSETTAHTGRDQVLRNLDVGSWYAGVREFYFSLLILRPDVSLVGVQLVQRYKTGENLTSRVPHRLDGLTNVRGMSLLEWIQLASLLGECAATAPHEDERPFAARAVGWLEGQGIGPAGQNR